MIIAHDDATLAFYALEARRYAKASRLDKSAWVDRFAGLLPPGAAVLELGCGAGGDTLLLRAHGLSVTATDGCAAMARQAEQATGQPVKVMRFDAIAEKTTYAGVWANACLLHVPDTALTSVLALIHAALVHGGVLYASFKAGSMPGRDTLGRYYNYPSPERLRDTVMAAGNWHQIDIESHAGGGYYGVAVQWLHLIAIRDHGRG